ncbi:ABC transporter permease [Catenulispora sp. NF23]|uniref:ABC transporter permease n=1 Tax=Catenulispora pinistramenti TaxID=2705254 RepID=A0ABS5L6X5_9ACTN|nr:ABC transporter permease [Catenulispora pinistramenti]MBS2538577.1 ABC transporter permease [Catenulispora pinistramenti]MBS2553954.1 ABC transporter permease [Catenulispora pinistramenti]
MAATATLAASVRSRRPALTAFRKAVTRKPGRIIGLAIIVFFILLAICGPWFYGRLAVDPNSLYAAPSAKHWLGTDFAGSDVLQEVVTGGRYVLATAALSALFTSLFGVTIGLVAGYQRGLTDSALMRLTDFVLTIPGLPLLIILSTVWNFGSPWKMGLVLGVTGWGGVARAVRSQALSLRERGFLEAARGLGLSRRHILLKEMLPNVAPYAAMQLMLSMIAFIGAEVGLFFLGLVPFSSTNWGVMLNQAVFSGGAMETPSALIYLLAPLVCILVLTLGIVLFLDAIDELFNPRLRERV